MPELTPEQKAQLDKNIRAMISQGASESDVMSYANDFRLKYDPELKKKEPSTPSLSAIGEIGGRAGTSNGSSPQSEKQRLTDFIQGTKTKPTKEDYATAIAKGKPVLLKQGQQIGSDFGQQINKEAEKEQLISKASGIPSIPSIENNIIKQGGDKTSSWYENTQQKYSNKLKEIEDVTKYQFDNIIAEAERQSGDNITVPKDKTSLPNQSFLGVVGGNVTVDRKEFIKEWQTKKQEWLKNENVEVEKLKTRADQALDATTESMKPILEYAANNLSVYSKKNNDGVIVADPNEIDKLAQRTAAKYGVAGDGLYKKLIYNKITENINHAIIKPEVDKVFESKVKDAFGGKSLDDVMGDEYKAQVENLSEVTKITNSTKNDISVVSEKIKQDAQGEVGRINELAKAEIEEIKKQYNEVANTATTQEELDNTNAIFNKRIEEVGLKFLSDQNEINSRFNKIYTESINGITRVATKRLEDIAKSFKYKPSDELQAKIKNLYNDSYTSVIDKRGEAAEIRDAKKTWIGEGIAKMTTQLGGAIKNQATSLGWDAGEIIGDVLSSSYTPSSSELDSWKDIFNPRKLVTSGMSLAGGMLPTIAGTAAVTATTGGAGTPAALRMALAAITSFTFDTAQQMGSVWNEKFSETGNLSDANKAAKTMLDGQKAIMWTYAGSGLPFMGSSVKLAKNRAARVLLGIGIQHTSETGQEWFQDAVETAAIEGKSLKDAMGNLTWDRLKNNSLQIAPLSIFMGGGGQVGGILSEASKNRAMKANGEAFALKSEFNKLAPSQMNQFLFDMIQRQGMPFSKGYVASLFTSGHIDKTQLVEMQNLLSNSETLIKNANTYGLTPAQQKVYFWLDANKNKAIEDVAAQTDPIFIKAAEAKVKAIEQDMVNLASGEKVDYTVLTYPNNEQYVLSNQEAEQALKGNQFLSAYKNGDIKIETFGKRGGVQEQLDEIDSKKEPVKGHMAFEGSELNELETKAIEGLQGKDFAGSPIKPYTDVIQNPEASIEDKKEALKGLSDQLTAKGTEVVVGTTLGKEADLIYDLGYEVAQESEALQKLQSAETKIEEPTVSSAVIEIGGKLYEGKNHAEAILKAKADGQDISRVNRQAQGKFKLSDGTIIDRAEAKKRFGQDRSELMIEQDAAADQANKDYRKITDPNLPTVSETEGAGSSGVGGDVKAKNKAFEELVNLIPTTDLRRPNGSIGTQGFSPENLVEVARHIAKEMGFDIPAYDKNKGTSEIKQVIDYLKNNKEAQQKIRDYVVKDPVVVSLLPDNTYEIEDGNHRANLLNLIGVDVIPTIELNGRDKQTAINEHNSKVEAVEQSIKETTKAETPTTNTGVEEGSGGVGGDVDLSNAKLNYHVSKSPQGVQGEVRFGNGLHGKGFYTASEKSKVPFSGGSEQFLILTKKPFEENWRNNYRDKGVNDDMRTETLLSQGYDTIKTGDYEVAIGSPKQIIKIEKGTTYNDILKQATDYFGNEKDAADYLKSKGIEQSLSKQESGGKAPVTKPEGKSDADIEKRMSEIEGDRETQDEFNSLEKEMEKRERASVFDVPLGKVNDAVDGLVKKEKDKPNGFGSFIETSDARKTKEIADKYSNAEEITDAELRKDFKDAVMGNPDTWYADGLKLRESMKEASNRGIDTKELIAEVEKEFVKDGYTPEDAKATVAIKLSPIFKDSQKVNEKQLPTPKAEDKAPVTKPNEKVAELEKERDAKITKEGKPEVKMEFVTAKELVDSKDPIGNKKIHTDIKDRYKKMRELLDCLWA